MTITVEFTTSTNFVYTVGFDAQHAACADDDLISLARPFAAKEWSNKIRVSAEVDRVENAERATEAILSATARVIR